MFQQFLGGSCRVVGRIASYMYVELFEGGLVWTVV